MNGFPKLADYALLTLLAVIFASSFVFTSIAVRDIPPFLVVAGRLSIALVLFFLLMSVAGSRWPRGCVWIYIAGSAFFGNALPFSLINWAQTSVEASVTSIYMAVMPLATVVLAHVTTSDEKLNGGKFAGVLLGLAGVVVLMGFDSLRNLGGNTIKELAVILAALCYAVNALITRKLTGVDPRSLLTALMLLSLLMVLPFALLSASKAALPDSYVSSGYFAVLALGVGPTAIASYLLLLIISRQGASFLSQINFLVPLAGTAFGIIFLQEHLPADVWLALLLILGGIMLARVSSSSA